METLKKIGKLFIIGLVLVSSNVASVYEDMREQMMSSFEEGVDSYVEEYKDFNPCTRFPEMVRREGDFILFDNLRLGVHYNDQGKKESAYWGPALIDLSRVRNVTFWFNRFNFGFIPGLKYPAGHAQLMIEFDQGGVVTPYGEIGGLVFSYEIHFNKGQSYDPIFAGTQRKYTALFLIASRKDMIKRAEEDNGTVFSDLDLEHRSFYEGQNVPKDVAEHYFEKAFAKEELMSDKYHTLKNSCITKQFDTLDEILPYKIKAPLLPHMVPYTIEMAGLRESGEPISEKRIELKKVKDLRAYARKWFRTDKGPDKQLGIPGKK